MVNTVCLVVTGLTLMLKRTPLSAGIAIDGLNTSARFLPLIPIYKRICCMDTFLYIHSSFSRIRHFHFLKIQSSCECYVTSAMCGATHNACYRLGQKRAEHKEIRLHIWRFYACDVFPVTAEGPACSERLVGLMIKRFPWQIVSREEEFCNSRSLYTLTEHSYKNM